VYVLVLCTTVLNAADCVAYGFLQIIIYEGQDKNPEMCRVLLTHEIMCRYAHTFLVLLTIVCYNTTTLSMLI